MDFRRQIDSGRLVCPKTKKRLILNSDEQMVCSEDNIEKYTLIDRKVPVMLVNADWASTYVSNGSTMLQEYNEDVLLKRDASIIRKLKRIATQDYRATSCIKAFQSLFRGSSDRLCLSIGGGPSRAHPELVNVNIGPFQNVDVVADAHLLPYADNSVDSIHCEAVLEHLHDPVRAVKEMYRILIPGEKAYICTPFLQGYHGYPHHYQNFTLTGHRELCERQGFRVVECGTCVGPTYTVVSLISIYIKEYFPRFASMPFRIVWGLVGAVLRPLDRLINTRGNSFVLASTTYVLVEK